MIYIYDILLNWSDLNLLYDFYEWNKKDTIEHIKKIPLFKISRDSIYDFFDKEIEVEKSFLEKIDHLTEVYRNKKIETIPYACLLTDGTRTIAVEFNQKGIMTYHSKLLLDEEDDVVDLSSRLEFSTIEYKTLKTIAKKGFYTRQEEEKRKYLITEFEYAYFQNNEEKLTYLYQEYFGEIGSSFENMYEKLKDSFQTFDSKHDDLYQLLKLSHTKKNAL